MEINKIKVYLSFLNQDELEIFQNEITDMSSKYDYVYLAGDFNAQTANLTDYTTEDEFLSKHFDFDDELSSFLTINPL